ncbi:unnamed protein product [Blepharisma stoltei]|uniref:Ubiquitin-like protease family profile domain-containing protein n=1 Tax=Blepharisma stoltei TaxID=1481888 RepID=A0AAU9ILX0_9CILI|nr:unnamed protein product [Blepharisma stoltei]
MDILKNSLAHVLNFISMKRSRSSSDDKLINLKRKKVDIDLHLRKNSEIESYTQNASNEDSQPTHWVSNIQDPHELYRSVVTKEEENSPLQLKEKVKTMKSVANIIVGHLIEHSKSASSEKLSNKTINSTDDSDSSHKLKNPKHALTFEEMIEVERIFNCFKNKEIFSQNHLQAVTYSDIKTLKPQSHVNEKVIDFYVGLIDTPDSMVIFDHKMFSMLEDMEMRNEWDSDRLIAHLKRTIGDNIYADQLIFPVLLKNNHWVAALINNDYKSIDYFDSMGDANFDYVCSILEKFVCVIQNGENEPYDWNEMKVPEQTFPYDSGVFMLKTLTCLANRRDLDFCQNQIRFLRKMMVLEIKNVQLFNSKY